MRPVSYHVISIVQLDTTVFSIAAREEELNPCISLCPWSWSPVRTPVRLTLASCGWPGKSSVAVFRMVRSLTSPWTQACGPAQRSGYNLQPPINSFYTWCVCAKHLAAIHHWPVLCSRLNVAARALPSGTQYYIEWNLSLSSQNLTYKPSNFNSHTSKLRVWEWANPKVNHAGNPPR